VYVLKLSILYVEMTLMLCKRISKRKIPQFAAAYIVLMSIILDGPLYWMRSVINERNEEDVAPVI
jgi:hypothetical protein